MAFQPVTNVTLPEERTKINANFTELYSLVVTLGGSDPITIQAGAVADQGESDNAARADHTHAISVSSPVTLTPTATNTEGSSSQLARADHQHAINVGDPVTIVPVGTNSAGTLDTFARADHVHAIGAGTPISLTAEVSNIIGVSNNFSRADHKHGVGVAAPATLTPSGSNVIGSSTSFSRADHKHAINVGNPVTLTPSATNSGGSSTNFARADHKHAINVAAPVTLTPSGTNDLGSSTNFARSDHKHAVGAGTPVDLGPSNSIGTSNNFSRSDHVHKYPTAEQVGVPEYIEDVNALAASIPPPTLDLDFEKGGVYKYAISDKITTTTTLTDVVSYTRGADPTTFHGPSGFENTAGNDEPVIAYSPFTRKLWGLLLQTQRVNDIADPRTFGGASWFENDLVATKNQVGLDGVANTAWALVENNDTTQTHNLIKEYTINANETRIVIIKFKSLSGNRRIRLRCDGHPSAGTDRAYSTFDPDTGTKSNDFQSGNGILLRSFIAPLNDGYYVGAVAFTLGSGITTARILLDLIRSSDGAITYDGDGTSGIILASVNAQEGDIITSDILANNLRIQDQLSIGPSEIKNIANNSEGTLFWEATPIEYSDTKFNGSYLRLHGASVADRFEIVLVSSTGPTLNAQVSTYHAGGIQDVGTRNLGVVEQDQIVRVALTYTRGGNIEASVDGEVITITNGNVWNTDLQHIVCYSVHNMVTGVRKLRYIPKRLQQDQLNYLTRPNQ